MKYGKVVGLVVLALVGGFVSGVPIPPFTESQELQSMAAAALLLLALLFAPFLKSRRRSLAFFTAALLPLRAAAEWGWELCPRQLMFLSRAVGADGEGSYNADAFQVYLMLVVVALALSLVMQPNKALQGDALASRVRA